MIGQLRGKILVKQPPQIVLDVQGVGYEVEAPLTVFYELPGVGEELRLFIHTHVREDAFLLFGFASDADRQLFRSLIKVNGVGARLALTILSGIETQDFVTTVKQQEISALVKLPGVGKKTAERLVIEMRDKVDQLAQLHHLPLTGGHVVSPQTDHIEEAVNALVALGYKPNEASRMVRQLSQSKDQVPALNLTELSTEEIIKQALKNTMS